MNVQTDSLEAYATFGSMLFTCCSAGIPQCATLSNLLDNSEYRALCSCIPFNIDVGDTPYFVQLLLVLLNSDVSHSTCHSLQ
jgi:hypothetical protein